MTITATMVENSLCHLSNPVISPEQAAESMAKRSAAAAARLAALVESGVEGPVCYNHFACPAIHAILIPTVRATTPRATTPPPHTPINHARMPHSPPATVAGEWPRPG